MWWTRGYGVGVMWWTRGYGVGVMWWTRVIWVVVMGVGLCTGLGDGGKGYAVL